MLFAGLAASAAVDLLSLLQGEKKPAKAGTPLTAQSSFSIADLGAVKAAPGPSQSATGRSEALSRDALDTLLSAQGQAQSAQRKKRSMSVLLDLLRSSQNGSVGKSDFDAAAGEGSEASELFDRIDNNHDSSVNVAELSAFLDTYRRNSEAGMQGRARALAVIA